MLTRSGSVLEFERLFWTGRAKTLMCVESKVATKQSSVRTRSCQWQTTCNGQVNTTLRYVCAIVDGPRIFDTKGEAGTGACISYIYIRLDMHASTMGAIGAAAVPNVCSHCNNSDWNTLSVEYR